MGKRGLEPRRAAPVKVLLVHDRYLQQGGEDILFEIEGRLLEQAGHEVVRYEESNERVARIGRLRMAGRTIWSVESCRKILSLLEGKGFDVVHLHNTFPLISPSAYYACARAGVPTVQSVHNYRLVCPVGTFFRDGRICEDCLGRRVAWPALVHKCYRGSRLATLGVVLMLFVHRMLGTWRNKVGIYAVNSDFERDKMMRGGIPAHKIVLKTNYMETGIGKREGPGEYGLFVGRFVPEKGVRQLVDACAKAPDVPMRLVGDGPLFDEISARVQAGGIRSISLVGRIPHPELWECIRKARFLVFPSCWYEGLPMTLLESFAAGVPIVASRLGAMAEVIEDGRTGLLFEPGSVDELAGKIAWAWNHPVEMSEMGKAARREYELKYAAGLAAPSLAEIYRRAIGPACPFCTGKAVLRLPGIGVWECVSCRLQFKHPAATPAALGDLYTKRWTDPATNEDEIGGTTARLAELYAKRLASSLGIESFKGLRILDYGAGLGDMSVALARMGADVSAYEPFGHAYLKARGIRAFASLDEIGKRHDFDGVVMLEVLEHLPSPWAELKGMREMVKETGWLFLTTPNRTGLNARLRGERWKEARDPEHLFLFSPRNLERMLNDCGYRARRLRWFVPYRESLAGRLLNGALQMSRLDGDLRYLARMK